MEIENVLDLVSQITDVKKEDILGKSRKHNIILARHITFSILHDKLNMSNSEIGRRFGMTHSNVIQMRRKINDLLDIGDKEYTFYYNKIIDLL